MLEASFYMFLRGQTGEKASFVCWLVPTLHFLRPFVDFLGMKLDELRGPDLTMRCFCFSMYTLQGVDWCALLFLASNRICMFAYTMVIGQTSTWICVLHHSLCLTDEFQRRTKPVLDWVSVCKIYYVTLWLSLICISYCIISSCGIRLPWLGLGITILEGFDRTKSSINCYLQ